MILWGSCFVLINALLWKGGKFIRPYAHVCMCYTHIFRLSSMFLHFLPWLFSQSIMILFYRFRQNKGWCWRKKLRCKEGDLGSYEGKGAWGQWEERSVDMRLRDLSATRGAFEAITSPVTSRHFFSIITQNSKLSSN